MENRNDDNNRDTDERDEEKLSFREQGDWELRGVERQQTYPAN